MDRRGEVAKDYMKKGCNCCQSVVLAFPDILKLDQETLSALAASFGGGMGYLGLTCGALAGAGMVLVQNSAVILWEMLPIKKLSMRRSRRWERNLAKKGAHIPATN